MGPRSNAGTGKPCRWLVPLTTAAAVATTFGALVVLVRQPWRQVRALPNGLTLGLDGVTFTEGNPHQRNVGQWWQKAFEPLLPPDLQPREITVGAPSGPNRSGLVCWFTVHKPERRPPPRASFTQLQLWSASGPYPCVETVDENGDTVGPLTGARLQTVRGPKGVLIIPLEAFPRRGRDVRLRFYRRESPVPAAEFRFPNPAPGPHPI